MARVGTVTFDASTLDDVDKTVMRCFEAAAEAVDLVIMAVGELGLRRWTRSTLTGSPA